MTKFNQVYNTVITALEDNEEAQDALSTLLDLVEEQGFKAGNKYGRESAARRMDDEPRLLDSYDDVIENGDD